MNEVQFKTNFMKNALLILIPFFIGCINPKFKHEVALKTSSLKAKTPKENGDTIQIEKKGYLKRVHDKIGARG
jgi:hypothetical protein